MKSGERSVFSVAENKMVLRCSSQLASEMGPYTASTQQGSDLLLKYVEET